MITGTIKKNWKMLITVLAAVIGVLARYGKKRVGAM